MNYVTFKSAINYGSKKYKNTSLGKSKKIEIDSDIFSIF